MLVGEKHPVPFIDRIVFLLFSACIFTYIVIRAASIPWVHDESTTIYWYVERGEFLPYTALWDAGNHFLSTAIGIVAHKIWGLSLPGSRIGSILAFPIFAWGVWRLGEFISDRWIRWICWVALLMCPFLLDFFSLFRGYALGMAFWIVAIDAAIRYFRGSDPRDLIQLSISLFLADMAVLSLVPLWALIIAAIGVHGCFRWMKQRGPFPWRIGAIWFLLGAVPLAFGLLLAWEMRRRALLYHGSTEGFIEVTISSLARYVIGSDVPIVLALVVLIIVASLVIIFSRKRGSVAALIGTLLFTDVLMRIGMAWILGVNYPEDRAALHMVPLAILFIAFTADGIEVCWQRIFLMSSLLYLPLRTAFTLNTDHTLLWPEQSVPIRFLQKIEAFQKEQGRPLMIGAYHQLSYAIPYAARTNGIGLQPPDVIGFPKGAHDVRIVDDRFIDQAIQGFQSIDHSPGNGLHLLKRKAELRSRQIDQLQIEVNEDAEFMELWRPERPVSLRDLRIEIRTRIRSDQQFLDLLIVASQKLNGGTIHYNSIPISHFRPRWKGEELHMMLDLPRSGSDETVIYFWNPKKQAFEMDEVKVTIHEVIDPL